MTDLFDCLRRYVFCTFMFTASQETSPERAEMADRCRRISSRNPKRLQWSERSLPTSSCSSAIATGETPLPSRLGYSLGALEADDHLQVEETLLACKNLPQQFEVLRRGLEPLEGDKSDELQVPSRLAARSCRLIRDMRVSRESHREQSGSASPSLMGLNGNGDTDGYPTL